MIAYFMITFIMLCLTVFTISSGFLYSEGPAFIRDWILRTFKGKLRYLAVCQLCCSFWFALSIEWMMMEYFNISAYIFIALAVAGISWLLGAFTLMCLHFKCACQHYCKFRGYDDLK